MSSLDTLAFDNGFARLPGTFHARVQATPVPDPYLVCHSPDALALLGLDADAIHRRELI